MSLLAPWFLFVALAITLPLWLHRLQTQSAVRRPFSSTMLLESTEKQVHVKKKLKYRVLLSMRVAMLLLLALILAKPIWTKTAPAFSESAATHVVLIDTSASMLRAGVFDRAVEAARNAIDSIPNGSLIQVVNADSRIHVAGELSADKAVHRSALATIEAGATRLDFGEAMGAIDTFAENLPPPVILHFVSDFQDSGMPIRFADLAATNIAELITHRVAVDARFNWRVEYARATAAVVDIGVIGSGEIAGRASVGAILNNRLVEQRDLVETGRSVHRFSGLQLEPGDNRLTVSIAAADDLAIDNEWYQVIEDTPPAPIPLITANRGRRAAMYLETALQADPRSNYRIEFMPVSETDFRTLSRYRWAVIDDLGSIGSELEAVIVSFIENGGNLLAFAGQGRAAAEQLPVSRHRVRATAVSANENEFLTIGQIDTGHPVLSDIEGWHSVNITRNIAVDVEDGDQVLIRLENATPFLIERRLGRGRILLLTSGLDNEWNDLPIRPVFVSFVVESARYLSGVGDTTKSFTTGDALPLSLIGGASGQVVDPQGNTVLSLVDTTREQQIRLEQPGFYEVYTPQGDYLVAVNTDPRESQAETVADETLGRWAATMGGQVERNGGPVAAREPAVRELWHALLFILALLVIGESIVGNINLKPHTEH